MSMEKKRPQLSLDELHQLKWLMGGALALLSAWAAFYLESDVWALAVAVTVAVPVVLARPAWAARWPAWAHRLVFPAIVLFFALDLYTAGEVLPALIRLDLLLLLYRGTTLRKRRDDLQLVVLGLFLILVAGVLTVSLAFAAQILAFTACALVFLLVVTLVDAREAGSPAAPQPPGATPAWTQVRWHRLAARSRAAADGRLLALAAVLFAGLVGLSAVLFMVMPRFELANSLFLDRLIKRPTRTGFSDTIRFNDVTDIQQDTSVALRVETPGRVPPAGPAYWRMVVLDEYRDGGFRVSNRLRGQGWNYTNEGFARDDEGDSSGLWTLYLEAGVSRYLPLSGGFGMLQLNARTDFRFNHVTRILALRNDPATMVAYRVTGLRLEDSFPVANLEPGMLELGMGGEDRAALKKMAEEIAGGAPLDAMEFARRATDWLDRRHGYSLTMQLPPGRGDPLVRWLQSREPGHCELFAGGLVMLARAAGHPARVVAGFKGGDWNAFESYLMVRNSDAHAWAEIYDPAAAAWRREDPTPAATEDGRVSTAATAARARMTAADRSWSARFDSLRMLWYRHIVNFDLRSQRETLQAVRQATQQAGVRLRAAWGRAWSMARAWLRKPWSGRRTAEMALAAAAMTAAVLAARRIRWRPGWRFGAGKRMHPVRREAGRWLLRIADRGSRTGAGMQIHSDLQRLRYGRRETWPEPAAVFRRARRQARR